MFAATLLCALSAAELGDAAGNHIRADVQFLSSDLLEGRGVGTRGGQLATEYIASQLTIAGAKPAGAHGSYFQPVRLVGVTTEPGATLSASSKGRDVNFRWLDDFVGVNLRQQPEDRFDADAVFVGHGIAAPEFNWDDYKGVDVHGKLVVLFTNEPPSDDPKFFGGRALTYYGRWTYKYEEAARRGALGVLIIHTTPTAGYGWDVVRSSWSKEDPQVPLKPGAYALAFAGWLTQEAGGRLLALSGHTVDELLTAANNRDFHPIPLGIHIQGNTPAAIRQIETRNVAGVFRGSDPAVANQFVIFTAHWDHLGIGPAVNGDRIYNGAVDNASGCGVLLQIAREWSELNPKPRRSALFLAVTAEEAGLRGSEFYAQNPLFPLKETLLDLNFDAIYPFGRTRDLELEGAERTPYWSTVRQVARNMGLQIAPPAHPEQGDYFRSDHFSFAKAGVPAFSVSLGTHFYGKPDNYGEQIFEEYNSKHYHQPSDEYHEDWDFAGMSEVTRFAFTLGMDVANSRGTRVPAVATHASGS